MIGKRGHESNQLRGPEEVQPTIAVVVRERAEGLGPKRDSFVQSIGRVEVESHV